MFAPAPKKAAEPVEKPTESTKADEIVEPPSVEPELSVSEPAPTELVEKTPVETTAIEEPELAITPSKDELTEDNLEQLPDTSG